MSGGDETVVRCWYCGRSATYGGIPRAIPEIGGYLCETCAEAAPAEVGNCHHLFASAIDYELEAKRHQGRQRSAYNAGNRRFAESAFRQSCSCVTCQRLKEPDGWRKMLDEGLAAFAATPFGQELQEAQGLTPPPVLAFQPEADGGGYWFDVETGEVVDRHSLGFDPDEPYPGVPYHHLTGAQRVERKEYNARVTWYPAPKPGGLAHRAFHAIIERGPAAELPPHPKMPFRGQSWWHLTPQQRVVRDHWSRTGKLLMAVPDGQP